MKSRLGRADAEAAIERRTVKGYYSGAYDGYYSFHYRIYNWFNYRLFWLCFRSMESKVGLIEFISSCFAFLSLALLTTFVVWYMR